MPNIFYPRKKIVEFDKQLTFVVQGILYAVPPGEVPCESQWQGVFRTTAPSAFVEIAYGGELFKKLIIEDWNGESLEGRDYDLLVEITSEFLVRPVLSIPVSDDGTGEPGEHHFLLEPITLPVLEATPSISGGGLFERALAEPGKVNPGTVRYSVQCEDCAEAFTFRSHHTGFLEVEYCYCDKSSQPLVIPIEDPLLRFKRPGVESKPEDVSPAEIAHARRRIDELEKILPESDFSGSFRWLAPFRCPYCGNPFIDFRNNLFRKAWEYYACCHKGCEMKSFSSEMLKAKEKEEKEEKDNKTAAGEEK